MTLQSSFTIVMFIIQATGGEGTEGRNTSLFVRSFSDDEKSFMGFRLDGLLVVGDDDGAEGGVLGVHLRSRLQNFFLCKS